MLALHRGTALLLAILATACPGPDCTDLDGDGFCSTASGGSDCDDAQAAVHPGAQEICGDAVDQDCTWDLDDRDLDGDGYVDAACLAQGGDCDDMDPAIHPGAAEICADDIDQDCSGVPDDKDQDGDGYLDVACGGDDCDDDEVYVNPDRLERCDGLDNDCDGSLPEDEQDMDQDGWLACDDDCDDNDPLAFPGAEEQIDGRDLDCDGVICEGESSRGLAGCLLEWLARYDYPEDCEADDRVLAAGQPAIETAVAAVLDLGSADEDPVDRDGCLSAAAAVESALELADQGDQLEALCVEGQDDEHLLLLRERGSAERGGLALFRLAGWRPRILASGQSQDLVLGAPHRDHLDITVCGDADLYTFHLGLRETVETTVPRAFLANGFPRWVVNATGAGAESDIRDALPGLLEQRGVERQHWPNRRALAASELGVYYGLANPVDGSLRDAILFVDTTTEDALPHCVFGHPDYLGPDGDSCDLSDESSPYLDDLRSLRLAGDWLMVVDAGSQPTLHLLELYASGHAASLEIHQDLSALAGDRPFCEPQDAALHLSSDEQASLFLLDTGGTAACGDGGVKLQRLALSPSNGSLEELETLATGLQGAARLAVDSHGNLLLSRSRDGLTGAAQDLLAWPLASGAEPAEPLELMAGDDCRLVDSRFGTDHRIEDSASLAFSSEGIAVLVDADGNEVFGGLLDRDDQGGLLELTRLAETDLVDDDGLPALGGIAATGAQAWLQVDESGSGTYDLVQLQVHERGDLLESGNDEERGRLTPYHHYLQALATGSRVLHLQLHGYDEDDPQHAALAIPGSQQEPYQWAALLSPGLPWADLTLSVQAVALAFQQAFADSGTELFYAYPSCVSHHDLGARSNRQGQLINYGELQAGIDGLSQHYDDPEGAPPSDEFLHLEWPLALREQLYDPDSEASARLRSAMESLVSWPAGSLACAFTPDSDLPGLPDSCSLP